MSKLGKYVVFWDTSGSNIHHYFDTYEEAAKYCNGSSTYGINIAYVLASRPPSPMHEIERSTRDFLSGKNKRVTKMRIESTV